MPKRRLAGPRNLKSRATVGIGAGDFSVSRHPVILVSHTLFGGKQWQQGCQGVNRYGSTLREIEVFAREFEIIADGVIAHRMALATAPLRANKTMVKEFELTDLTCQGVGRVLLNDVTSCSSDAGNRDDCVSTTRVSSRASVSLVK